VSESRRWLAEQRSLLLGTVTSDELGEKWGEPTEIAFTGMFMVEAAMMLSFWASEKPYM